MVQLYFFKAIIEINIIARELPSINTHCYWDVNLPSG